MIYKLWAQTNSVMKTLRFRKAKRKRITYREYWQIVK